MILDTNAVSGLFAGDTGLDDILAPSPRHHLPVIVIGEYRYGISRSRRREHLLSLLSTLTLESVVLRLDETTAKYYAEVRLGLQTRGRPIPENDVWIAALALQHSLPVVSRDRHFDEVSALERLSW